MFDNIDTEGVYPSDYEMLAPSFEKSYGQKYYVDPSDKQQMAMYDSVAQNPYQDVNDVINKQEPDKKKGLSTTAKLALGGGAIALSCIAAPAVGTAVGLTGLGAGVVNALGYLGFGTVVGKGAQALSKNKTVNKVLDGIGSMFKKAGEAVLGKDTTEKVSKVSDKASDVVADFGMG